MNINEKRLFLLDMDGTIYLGNKLFSTTFNFLEQVRKNGGKFLFLTNNSSKSVKQYVQKLAEMGIFTQEDDFVTSTQVMARKLRKKYNSQKLYALGTAAFRDELLSFGLNITNKPEKDVVCLVMGFDTELTFQKLEDACVLLANGVDYIAANPDLTCPTEWGSVPDCGSVSAMLANTTGREPLFIGKPNPEMVLAAIGKTGFTKNETVMVGDRLYTDIACGIAAGIDTILVLSGETKIDMVQQSIHKPGGIYADVGEIAREIKK
ncbi:MAG: HAD-IIA family hydrolase [Oscillospiraceae bacterium]|nr:HAD-IIA family hydrolase [Oscillospiraceae bacterium]